MACAFSAAAAAMVSGPELAAASAVPSVGVPVAVAGVVGTTVGTTTAGTTGWVAAAVPSAGWVWSAVLVSEPSLLSAALAPSAGLLSSPLAALPSFPGFVGAAELD